MEKDVLPGQGFGGGFQSTKRGYACVNNIKWVDKWERDVKIL